MVTRDFSGDEVIKVLGNKGGFSVERQRGDHVRMKWTAPPDHDTDNRYVTVPRHDSLPPGTLRNIMEQAGGDDFDEFCKWIDRNR